MNRRKRDHEGKARLSTSVPWYERTGPFSLLLIGVLVEGVFLLRPRDAGSLLSWLAYAGVALASYWGGTWLWSFLWKVSAERYGNATTQLGATVISLSLFMGAHLIFLSSPTLEISTPWLLVLPGVQAVGVGVGRLGPAAREFWAARKRQDELVEILAGLAKKYNLDTGDDPRVVHELDRLLEDEVWDPALKQTYKERKGWIFQDLRERWRREKLGEVSDIIGMWRDIIRFRAKLRETFGSRLGSPILPERESLYPDMAILPGFHSELVTQIVRLGEYIDDFDRAFVHSLSGKKPESGDRALGLVLSRLGLDVTAPPAIVWHHLREIRNGVAHPAAWATNADFLQALAYFDLNSSDLFGRPRFVWRELSRAYLESLKELDRLCA